MFENYTDYFLMHRCSKFMNVLYMFYVFGIFYTFLIAIRLTCNFLARRARFAWKINFGLFFKYIYRPKIMISTVLDSERYFRPKIIKNWFKMYLLAENQDLQGFGLRTCAFSAMGVFRQKLIFADFPTKNRQKSTKNDLLL